MHEWLTVIIVLLIVGVLLDGVRRMRQARRNSLRMSLDTDKDPTGEGPEYGSELPNGGARIADRNSEQMTPESTDDSTNENDKGGNKEDNKEGNEDLYSVSNQSAEDDQSPAVRPFPTEQQTLHLEDSVPMLMDSLTAVDPDTINNDANVDKVSSKDHADNYHDSDKTQLVSSKAKKARDTLANMREPIIGADPIDRAIETPTSSKRIEPKLKSLLKKSAKASSLSKPKQQPEEVLIMNIKAAEGEHFHGKDLLKVILNQGLRYGEMNIFHRHVGEYGEGAILFSMVNMVVPGTFDLAKFDELSTPGVSVFLKLPMTECNSMEAFETMLITAKAIADALGGEVNDDQHSIMTKQTVEHYRERIRNFSLRQQLLERT